MVRSALKEMLQRRVADGSMMRLIGKCLHVRVLDGEEYAEPETGTAQGSILSPLLGNIYLHNVLDVWFENEVMPRLKGKAALIRYADDFVIGFETEPLEVQHRALTRRTQGHFNYFGVNGNRPALAKLVHRARLAWFKWLRRRSQKSRLNWERFEAIWRRFPLPRPRIKVQLWARS